MPSDDEILTSADVAVMFRVDAKTVATWAKLGRFPPGTVFRTAGGHRRYYRDKVEEYRASLGYRPETVASG